MMTKKKLLTMARVCASAVVINSGCSGEEGGSGPTPVQHVASVKVAGPSSVHNLHFGDSTRFVATLKDANGNTLTDRVVAWTSENPAQASISQDGLMRILSPRNFFVWVTATSEGVSGDELFSGSGWGFEQGTDPISLSPYSEANLGANIGAEGPPRIYLRCRNGAFDVFVTVSFVTASGSVRYRFNGAAGQNETWIESTNFHAVFYPGAPRAFADRVAAADTLIFEVSKYGGGTVVATFIPRGFDSILPAFLTACP